MGGLADALVPFGQVGEGSGSLWDVLKGFLLESILDLFVDHGRVGLKRRSGLGRFEFGKRG